MLKQNIRLNISSLGCGPISQAAHFESIRGAKNTNLYAICDVDAIVIGIADQFHVACAKKQ